MLDRRIFAGCACLAAAAERMAHLSQDQPCDDHTHPNQQSNHKQQMRRQMSASHNLVHMGPYRNVYSLGTLLLYGCGVNTLRMLLRRTIPKARLWEISENLHRVDPTKLERLSKLLSGAAYRREKWCKLHH
jgi:hypothetical protein